MKKMMMSLLLALMLTFVPSCLFAAEYVEIYSDSDYLIYLDTSSIQDQGTYYQAWTKWVFRGEAKKEISELHNKEVDHELALKAYSKKNKQTSLLAQHVYDKNGKVIFSRDYASQPISWNSVVPDSIGELVIEAVYFFAGK
jgi:hypothetical protein